MDKKIYVVTDLGPGDGGKGGVVHKISCMTNAHTIIKVGGAQGSHGVCTSAGEKFAFSQWGCGTFEGVKTHLSSRFVVSPVGLINESDALRYHHGIHDAFDLLTIDEAALCATPYHGIVSRITEMARGHTPRGTIGTGVGTAYRYAERYPELTLHARDLCGVDLRDKIVALREQILLDMTPVIQGEFLPEDRLAVNREVACLSDDGFLEYVVEVFREVAVRARVVDNDFLGREILAQDGVVIVESSHGVLTDRFQGFHPHTSAIRTLPIFANNMLRSAGFDGEVVNVGVHRAYNVRHGAGPMPTADSHMNERLLPGSSKATNRYQGEIRVGPLDTVLLRYALSASGGAGAYQALAITWFDQIVKQGVWEICRRYHGADDTNYFTSDGELRVRSGEGGEQLSFQENLGQKLLDCHPDVDQISILPGSSREESAAWCADVLREQLPVPVRMVSFGATEDDKVCI